MSDICKCGHISTLHIHGRGACVATNEDGTWCNCVKLQLENPEEQAPLECERPLMVPVIETNGPAEIVTMIEVARYKDHPDLEAQIDYVVDMVQKIEKQAWLSVHYLNAINKADQTGTDRPKFHEITKDHR